MSNHEHQVVEFGVRCEGCGYALDGLTRDSVCSECGFSITMSLPRERAGTPWQQVAGLWSLLKTWWLLLQSDACWREMRIDRASRRSFVGWCRVLAYAVLLPAFIWLVLIDTGGRPYVGALTYLVLLMIIPMFVVEVLMRVYGMLISWRLGIMTKLRDETQESAAHEQVVDHACVGMLIAPLFLALGVSGINIGMMLEHATGSMAAIRVGFWAGGVLAAIGLVLGLAAFELSYRRGWRAMRYRRVVGDEARQVNDDVYFEGADDGVFIERDFTGIKNLKRALKGNPLRAGGFFVGVFLKLFVAPGVYFVLWLVYGFEAGLALIIAIIALGVLSILHRMLMVPVRMLMGRRGR